MAMMMARTVTMTVRSIILVIFIVVPQVEAEAAVSDAPRSLALSRIAQVLDALGRDVAVVAARFSRTMQQQQTPEAETAEVPETETAKASEPS